jgi:hypothetical protein
MDIYPSQNLGKNNSRYSSQNSEKRLHLWSWGSFVIMRRLDASKRQPSENVQGIRPDGTGKFMWLIRCRSLTLYQNRKVAELVAVRCSFITVHTTWLDLLTMISCATAAFRATNPNGRKQRYSSMNSIDISFYTQKNTSQKLQSHSRQKKPASTSCCE